MIEWAIGLYFLAGVFLCGVIHEYHKMSSFSMAAKAFVYVSLLMFWPLILALGVGREVGEANLKKPPKK